MVIVKVNVSVKVIVKVVVKVTLKVKVTVYVMKEIVNSKKNSSKSFVQSFVLQFFLPPDLKAANSKPWQIANNENGDDAAANLRQVEICGTSGGEDFPGSLILY